MSTQQKALFVAKPQGEFYLDSTDILEPGPGEVQVQIHSTALNPVDWASVAYGILIKKYPGIVGYDAAGVVTKLGPGVSNFAVGDRILYCGESDNRMSTFQQYSVVYASFGCKIPSNLSLDEAATIPLTLLTAASGLYGTKGKQSSGAELYPPWQDGGRGKYAGEPLLILGAGSNVGFHAVQLAKLSGFSPIVAFASKSKEAHLKSLGATHVIDRSAHLPDFAEALKGLTNKPLPLVLDVVSTPDLKRAAYEALALGGKIVIITGGPNHGLTVSPEKEVLLTIAQPEIGMSLYPKLPELLESGEIKPSPTIQVLPGGLGGIVGGLTKLKTGQMTAMKLVVRPQETA